MEDFRTATIEVGYALAKEDGSFATGEAAARAALANIKIHPLSALLVFASVRYNLEELLSGIQSEAGDVPVFGASTAGEICGGPQHRSAVLVALASPHLRVSIGIGQAVSADWRKAVLQAIGFPDIAPFFSPHSGSIWSEMAQRGESAFGMLFAPGHTRHAYSRGGEILEDLKRFSLGRLPFFGGCAADDLLMEGNYVLSGNRAYPDSMLLAVFQTGLKFGVAMADGLRSGPRAATVTRVRDGQIRELDGQPAAEVLARMLDVPGEAIGGKAATRTTGKLLAVRHVHDQETVNVAGYYTARDGVHLTHPVSQGASVAAMEPTTEEMSDAGRDALSKSMLRSGISDPAVAFVCSSAFRSGTPLNSEAEEISRLAQNMPSAPLVGFYSIGELGVTDDGLSRHQHGAVTLLLLGRELSHAGRLALENQALKQELEASRRQSEQLLVGILSASPVGIGLAGPGRDMTWVNESWLKTFGYPDERECVGRSARMLYPSQEEFERVGEVIHRDLAANRQAQTDARMTRKDGAVFDAHMRFSVLDPTDPGKGFITAVTDISDRKRSEEEVKQALEKLRQSNEEIKALLDATRALLEHQDLERSARGVFAPFKELIGAGAGFVSLLSEDGSGDEVLFLDAGPRYCSVPVSGPIPIQGLRARAYRTGQVVYENDFHESVWTRFVPKGQARLENVMFSPIAIRGEVMGLIGMANKPGGFHDDDARLAQAFGELAALGLLNYRTVKSLEVSEEKMRLLIESSPVGIRIAQDGKYVYVNPAFTKMFGYESADGIIGMPVETLYAPESRELILRNTSRSKSPKEALSHIEAVGIASDGRSFDLEAWESTIEFQGKRASLAFLIDVSEAKSLRSQLVQAQKMEAIGTLTGGIAHDFNNLLQVVSGYSVMLLMDKQEGDPEYEDITKILQAAQAGSDLVQRLLTFGRKVQPHFRAVNLNNKIRQARKLLSRTIPKTIKIVLRLRDEVRPVIADSSQIEQILVNLAINARDAMPDGGTLTIETENVILEEEYCRREIGARPGLHAAITISDSGHGMDQKCLDRIFEPFFTTKGLGQGTGLGLAVVHGIVKQHGGHISCRSEEGVGTTFRIYLPAIESQAESEIPADLSRDLRGGSETILLVDDEPYIREFGQRMLGRAGYEVITAGHGSEALDIYRMMKDRIALVILDVIMPEMDGRRCLAGLLSINPKVKVIMSSGHTEDRVAREAKAAGAREFIPKPYDALLALRTIRKVLDDGL